METQAGSTDDNEAPTAAEAQRRLADAQNAESATRNPPLRQRFFTTQAILLAVACGGQALSGPLGTLVSAAAVLAVFVVGVRSVFLRPGYGLVGLDGPGAFPYLLAMCAAVGVPAGLALGLGQPWLWWLAGLAAALVTLEMGRRYRRAVGHV